MRNLAIRFGIRAIDRFWHKSHNLARGQNMATIYQRLGRKIRELRKLKGLSQEELTEAAGLDLTTVSEVESGKRNPSLKTVYKISLALKTSLSELFSF